MASHPKSHPCTKMLHPAKDERALHHLCSHLRSVTAIAATVRRRQGENASHQSIPLPSIKRCLPLLRVHLPPLILGLQMTLARASTGLADALIFKSDDPGIGLLLEKVLHRRRLR